MSPGAGAQLRGLLNCWRGPWHGFGLGQAQLSQAIPGHSSGVNSGQGLFPTGVFGGEED